MSEYHELLKRVEELQQFIHDTMKGVQEETAVPADSRPNTRRANKTGETKIPKASESELAGVNPRMRKVYDVVHKIAQLPVAAPFLYPVKEMYDPKAIPGYDNAIKRPMDFSTVLSGIALGRYTKEDQVKQDLKLIFDNCKLYLGPKHEMYINNAHPCWIEVESQLKKLSADKAVTPSPRPPSALPPGQTIDSFRNQVMKNIETLTNKDPDAHTDLIEILRTYAPNTLVEDPEGLTLDLENCHDLIALKNIDAHVASRLGSTSDAKRVKYT
eukprot:PhF_6_TR22227/c0_g1_i3/m.31392